jgi:hypothetical protein
LSVLEQQDPVELWLQGLEKQKTRDTYRQALKRLSDVSGASPFRMLEDARKDMKAFWVHIKADASKLKPHVRSSAISALRSYLRANGEFPPYDRLKRSRKSRRSARITWDQALKIADAVRDAIANAIAKSDSAGSGQNLSSHNFSDTSSQKTSEEYRKRQSAGDTSRMGGIGKNGV